MVGRFVLSALIALGALVAPPGVAQADSSGSVRDVTPTTRWLNAKERHTEFFTATFEAEAGEARYVGTELVVWDAKKTAPDEIFLGVTLTCTGPSGKVVAQAEAGRNVWPANSDFSIPVVALAMTKEAGTHTCVADVMMCDPGNCTAASGTGIVKVVTRKMNPREYSFLYISAALPSWAQSKQVPPSGDTLVPSGGKQTLSWGFDVTEAQPGPVRVGGVLSMTNCIEKSYPTACAKAKKTAIQGSATVVLSLTATQLSTESGVTCATVKATPDNGAGKDTITWQQHHAVYQIYIPDFTLSTAPGCGNTVQVSVVVQALKGNSVVVESGSGAKWSSTLYAIPGDSYAP